MQAPGDELWDNRFGIPGVEGGEVTVVAVAANGDIYIAGRFTEVGNVKANYIARWDGASSTRWATGGAPDAIAVDGNNLYAVGGFASAGNVSANGIAFWNCTVWSAVGIGDGATAEYGGRGLAAGGGGLQRQPDHRRPVRQGRWRRRQQHRGLEWHQPVAAGHGRRRVGL